jgi:hypothetical protein
MAVREKETAAVPLEEATTGYARFVEVQNGNFNALVRFNTILRDGAIEWSNNWLDFAGQHLNGPDRRNGGADPAEATLSNAGYMQETVERYLDQTAKFLSLTAKISRDCRMHLENHVAATLGRVRPR